MESLAKDNMDGTTPVLLNENLDEIVLNVLIKMKG
jgi:hypothetical protein